SLMPIFLATGCRQALDAMRGPIIYIANLLTEGRGMSKFTAADAIAQLTTVIGRPIDVVILNVDPPNHGVLERYAREHKAPLPPGKSPPECQVIEGKFWRGSIARHDRFRLRAAVWAVLAERLLLRPAGKPAAGQEARKPGSPEARKVSSKTV